MFMGDHTMAMTATERSRVLRERRASGKIVLTVVVSEDELVQRFGGYVAKYMGDGVLVYFGYPQAHENDAERAVRAALELIQAVGGLKSSTSLQTRVGISTGLVVVGDLIGSERHRSAVLSERRRTCIAPRFSREPLRGCAEKKSAADEEAKRPHGRQCDRGAGFGGQRSSRTSRRRRYVSRVRTPSSRRKIKTRRPRSDRAGLALIQALSGLKSLPMQTRVGVATGLVVVGDTIFGQTPNPAARLEGIAEAKRSGNLAAMPSRGGGKRRGALAPGWPRAAPKMAAGALLSAGGYSQLDSNGAARMAAESLARNRAAAASDSAECTKRRCVDAPQKFRFRVGTRRRHASASQPRK
jgi:class 3 adenylate cyclase